MAENKKSVILYVDWGNVFDNLEDAEAGKLIKHFFDYIRDKNPTAPDKLTQIAFEPIKLQLKRDLLKWDEKKDKRSEAGKKGMEARWHKKGITNDNNVIPAITKITVTDNVTVNVNDTVDVEIQTNNIFFEMFRRVAGYSIQDSELRQEVGRFRNKYPSVHPNQAGALINTWVSNIGKEQTPIKKMVL